MDRGLIGEWGKSVPVFVYGTLREGGRLRGYYLDDGNIDSKVERGTVHGYQLIDPPRWGFPLMVPASSGIVTGDLQWVKVGPRLEAMVGMEMGAGYDLSMVEVHTESMVIPVNAIAFTWQRDLPKGSRVVPSGDWLVAERQRLTSGSGW